MIVDAAAMMVWPNLDMFIEMGAWGGGSDGGTIWFIAPRNCSSEFLFLQNQV